MSLEGTPAGWQGGGRVLGSCGEHRNPRLEFAETCGLGQRVRLGPRMPWWLLPTPSRALLCSPFFLAAMPPPLLHSGTWLSAPLPPLRLHCQHSSLQGHAKEPLLTKGWGALVFGGRSRSKMTVWDEPALKWNHPSKVYLQLGQGPSAMVPEFPLGPVILGAMMSGWTDHW